MDVPAKDWLEKKYDRKRPLVETESARWLAVDAKARQRLSPEIAPITVCDREADFFEFLHSISQQSLRFVVGAKDRLIEGPIRFLFGKARGQPIAATREITIGQRGQVDDFFHCKRQDGPKRRKAFLLVQATSVTLPLPSNKEVTCAKPFRVNCVRVSEMDGDLKWVILTSDPIDTDEAIGRMGELAVQRFGKDG